MARYVDLDKVFPNSVFYVNEENPTKSIDELVNRLHSLSTIDVVGVCKCRDCIVPHNKWTGCPNLNGLIPPPDFYCAYGERKKNDKE